MAAMCAAHYTPTHSGPTYYAAQEPYRLSKHHGYCPRHASKEMQEANALCKKEYETMRQGAGRKTLGAVAQDFEIFLQLYREARQTEDARLQHAQRQRVLGTTPTTPPPQQPTPSDPFDWRYTPRNCTRKACVSAPYSPFAIPLFPFYHAPNPATQLLPLASLCPSCSRTESAAFGAKLMQKWGSRCGWDGEEWDAWYQLALQRRKSEAASWEKAQQRVVGERRLAGAVVGVGVGAGAGAGAGAVGVAVVGDDDADKPRMPAKVDRELPDSAPTTTVVREKRRKSFFKRVFRRSETTGAVGVAAAAAAATTTTAVLAAVPTAPTVAAA